MLALTWHKCFTVRFISQRRTFLSHFPPFPLETDYVHTLPAVLQTDQIEVHAMRVFTCTLPVAVFWCLINTPPPAPHFFF